MQSANACINMSGLLYFSNGQLPVCVIVIFSHCLVACLVAGGKDSPSPFRSCVVGTGTEL